MVSPGDVVSLTVEKPAVGGPMIARLHGRVVLVSGAIPGERISAKIERVAKNLAYARTVSVEERSEDRREEAGDPLCGGCLYAHIAYPRQCALKAAVIVDAFARLARLHLPGAVSVAPSPEEGYRMRARLHVRGSRIGFFREGTHELCEVRPTRQLLPASCDVLDRLAAGARTLALDAIDGLDLVENIDASERAVFVESSAPIDARLLGTLADTQGLSGLAWNAGAHGSAYVTDRLDVSGCAVTLSRHVRAFFQGNRYLLHDLATHVVGQIPEGSDVVDLYAGTGLFAIGAAVCRGATVDAVEGDRVAAADLERNAVATGGTIRSVHESVETFVEESSRVGGSPGSSRVVVMDPPRTGLSPGAMAGVIRMAAARIVYVSCDVATLARDARRLVDAGFALSRVDGFDLFPNTPHVETVVVFDRM